MILEITHTSTYADDFLSHCSSGTVHSVYNKTINIQTEGQLIALQTASSPQSPVSLITNLTACEMESLSIHAGQTVHISRDAIKIISPESLSVFLYRPVHIYHSQLTPLAAGSSPAVLESQVQLALDRSERSGFVPLFTSCSDAAGTDNMILSAVRERTSSCRFLLRDREFEEAAGVLAELIGLGIGLTPSGDDFLCGVLAALALCSLSDHPFARCLAVQIERHLTDTNDISRTFLRCALQNEFSHAVCRLSCLPSAKEILQRFEAVGHSSGMDTLCGILYALTVPLL